MRTRFIGWMAGLACALTAAAPHAAPGRHEEVIEAPGPQGPLRGVLLSPGAPGPDRPLVLIVPGSGPTDRDGNGPQGLNAATYRWLAEGLAEHGIMSLRIDKRGLFGSAAAIPDANAVTLGDYAQDVMQWVAIARQRLGVPCVWLLGHSEGGLVALMAAQRGTGLCGLLLAATPGRPLSQVLREQLRANPANAPVLPQALAAIDTLEAGRHVDMAALDPVLRPLFRPAVQGFLIDSFAVDPAALVATARGPVLILQGARDIQVGVDDARRLQAAAPQARMVLLPTANHVLKPVASDERAANLATYGQPDLALAPGVVEAITGFVGTSPAAR